MIETLGEFIPGEAFILFPFLLWALWQQIKDDKAIATDRDGAKPAPTVRLKPRSNFYDWRAEKWL
jgi:hypothetical protein